jgi:single-strand DNA-binding protein
MSVVQVMLSGRVGSSVEKRFTPDNRAVFVFRLELDDVRPSPGGDVQVVPVTCWQRLADQASEHLQPGMNVLVEGRLQFNNQTTPDGRKTKHLEVVASTIQCFHGDSRLTPLTGDVPQQGQRLNGMGAAAAPAPSSSAPTDPYGAGAYAVPSPATMPVASPPQPAAAATAAPHAGGGMFGFYTDTLEESEDDIPF